MKKLKIYSIFNLVVNAKRPNAVLVTVDAKNLISVVESDVDVQKTYAVIPDLISNMLVNLNILISLKSNIMLEIKL